MTKAELFRRYGHLIETDADEAHYANSVAGCDALLASTFELYERHGKKIGTDWAMAGARLLAGLGGRP